MLLSVKKLMFNTCLLLVCQLLVISTAHPWSSAHTGSQTSLHAEQFQKPHNPVLHLSKVCENLVFCCFNI